MNKLDTLEKLAKVSIQLRTDCVRNVSPQTILAMIALIRMQHEALVYCYDTEGTGLRSEALTAFEKFGEAE